MASIYEFELRGIKTLNKIGFTANLYYNNKKICNYTDNNDGLIPSIIFDKNFSQNDILNEIKLFYRNNPKEMIYNSDNYLIIEFVEELYRLKELETIFKKLNKKEKTSLIELKFSKRISYISEYQKEDICISTTLLNEEFMSKLLEKYKPVEYTIYNSINDFNIKKRL